MSGAGSDVVVRYDGTDITDHVMLAHTHFSSSANAVPGQAVVRCKDPFQELSFVTGRELTLEVDGSDLWGGYVMQVDYIHAFPADDTRDPETYRNRLFDLQCVDYNIMFDRRIVRNPGDWYHSISWDNPIYDGAVLRSVLGTYIDNPPGFSFDSTTVQDIYLIPASTEAPKTKVQQAWKVREAFELFASQSAAVYYVNPDKEWLYLPIESLIKRWAFSDVPERGPVVLTGDPDPLANHSTYPFREVTANEDGTILANDALVWAGSPWGSNGPMYFAREQDAVSQAERGRWQVGETYFNDDGLHNTQDGVDARAQSIVLGPPGADAFGQLKGYTNPQWHFRFAWWGKDVPYVSGQRDHVRPGDLLTIEMQTFFGPASALILPCRQLDISFVTNDPDGLPVVRFEADFALNLDMPFKLWDFLRRRTTVINTSPTSPIATPGGGTSVYGAYGQDFPTPTPNGSETVFTIPYGYISGQLNVYLNGLLQREGIDFTETDNVAGEFTMSTAPLTGENLYCTFRTLAS